ncbi:arylsulfatase [Nocardioides sp.]|uniref:arylsulfatase n=1 Tax=Nocardioides sp. TaxID=35761 RepID=UPI003526EF06
MSGSGSTAPRRPNIVMVLVDDMGFGASSCYGGPVRMPVADRLAAGGLRFSRFHVTALCSPTRQALMTGRNHHSVGMGVTTEMSTDHPGYNGRRPEQAATLAQILRGAGYRTAAFGKWHQTPPSEIGPDGPFDRWPTGEGFEHFYGFMGAEMNHWYPLLYDDTTPVEPDRLPEQGYHLSEDLVDHAVDWVAGQDGESPYFLYLAFGATHAPLHVWPDWIQRYAGRFDDGWDVARERILARQKELGVVPPETELAPWVDGVPHWDELSEPARRVAARLMETYAGFAEHTDAQVGRLLEALEERGDLDDTVFVYLLGDNGASGEGGIEGTTHEHLVGHGFADDVDDMDAALDEIGSPTTYALYPVGWALAMNTPYQWTKQVASHFGGTRDGLVVHWPAGIAERGDVRHQFHHVIDILPTLLETAGLELPDRVGGVQQQRFEGTSMAYCFDDAEAPDQRTTQYFEMIGNRGIYDRGWTASAQHSVPWKMVEEPRPFDHDRWELYDTTADWSQARDLAGERPDRVAELQAVFEAEAGRHQVFPLDDRVTERENPELAGRADPRAGRLDFDYDGRTRRLTEEVAPNLKNRTHRLEVDLTAGPAATGVLVAQGGRFGGWSLYAVSGELRYAYNRFGRDLTVVRGGVLPEGAATVTAVVTFEDGPPGGPADVDLLVDGESVARGRVPATAAYYLAFDETLDVGVDLGSPVSPDYPPADNAFDGEVHRVRVLLAERPPSADETEDLRALRAMD